MVDTKRYNDWIEMAKKDLHAANILYEHEADYGVVCFHLQQALEKYFKAYLIYKTGTIFEGHNLVKLCRRAGSFDELYNDYIKDCAFLNAFYIETRYPAEDPLNASKKDVEEGLKIVNSIIDIIEKSME